MKISIYVIVLFLFSCHEHRNVKSAIKSKQIRVELAEEKNTTNFYFYKPANVKQNSPFIIVIDPHGNGKLACLTFKKVAIQIGAISIGLNKVENNITDYQIKIKQAIQEVKNKFKINGKPILIAGFSGGARMAYSYAIQNNIDAVIMCGAGVGNNITSRVSFRLACISGYKDFNFVEQYYSPYSNLIENKNYISLHFNGIHEWPPEKLLLQAGNFVLKKNMVNTLSYNKALNTSEELLAEKNYIGAFKVLELIYKTCSPEQAGDYRIAIGQLLNNRDFKDYIKSFENILMEEQARNRNYMQNLIKKDFNWWKAEKQIIEKRMNDTQNELLSYSYYRTKAFIGVLLFSKTNASVRAKRFTDAQKFLNIYALFEPENQDVFYLMALFEYYKGESTNKITHNLSRALEFGFTDNNKMKEDFSEEIIDKIMN